MSDLVKRLRDKSGRHINGLYDDEAADEIERLRAAYEELLLAVEKKWPGESRHETALRYIRQHEASATGVGAADTARA